MRILLNEGGHRGRHISGEDGAGRDRTRSRFGRLGLGDATVVIIVNERSRGRRGVDDGNDG
jgi:hypothetical protein